MDTKQALRLYDDCLVNRPEAECRAVAVNAIEAAADRYLKAYGVCKGVFGAQLCREYMSFSSQSITNLGIFVIAGIIIWRLLK